MVFASLAQDEAETIAIPFRVSGGAIFRHIAMPFSFLGWGGGSTGVFLAAHNSKYARRIYIEEPVGGVYS